MREFFRGWRRKLGCVTLVMACALMGLWVRSLKLWDFYSFPTSERHHQFDSIDGGFIWSSWDRQPPENWASPEWEWIADDADTAGSFPGFLKFWDNPTNRHRHARYWYVYYWSLVIPLTLLSAYLLLWNPHRRTGAEHA